MTVSAPPRPPAPARTAPDNRPLDREEIEALVEALIEEARRETRRRHRRYWALAALAALVGAVILILLDGGAASQTASPALSARSGAAGGTPSSKIAFVRTVGCIPLQHCWFGLYVMNPDASGKRRLARHFWVSNLAFGYPVWSPDRRKLVFAAHLSRSTAPCASYCGKEIFVINADGSGLRRLTRNTVADSEPTWSPDGQKIAWTGGGQGTGEDVFVMNADGSDQRNLTSKLGYQGEPRWSPDGRAILFTAVQPVQPLRGAAPYRDVYVMNADGSGQRKLTHTREAGEFSPAWSPDGQQITFTRLAWSQPVEVGIVVMNADGSAKHVVTPTLGYTGDLAMTVTAAWSPDGQTIAFDAHDVIYVVNADGSGLRRLAQNATFDSWSPDGRKLIISRLNGLWVMNADGSGQRNLTSDGWAATWAR
jgi:Tol biopolymer transport system component